MTKLKSKKLSGKTIAIIVMAIAMVVMMAFGVTYALFTAQAADLSSGTIYTGHIKLNSAGTFITNTSLTGILPGDPLLTSAVTVTPDASDGGEYVAMKITLTDGTTVSQASDLGLTITVSTGWSLDSTSGVYVYVGSGSTPAIMTEQTTALPYDTTTNPSVPVYGIVYNRTDNWDGNEFASDSSYVSDSNYMDQEITITIQFASVQSKNNTISTVAGVVSAVTFATIS